MSSFRFFRPALFDALRGYKTFFHDVTAGVTVGIIAIPLAIGFAIASGASPSQGMWTAIIAGFLISAFGGSLVQVGGPTGAFVPILFAISATYGYEGLALATMMAGVFLFAIGALRLGGLIKFIPYPVVAGFTSGIAVVIAIGQLKQLLGLDVKLPAEALAQAWGILTHLSGVRWQSVAVGLASLLLIVRWPKRWHRVPPSIATILLGALAVYFWNPGDAVATIGSKFGANAMVGLPGLYLPVVTFERIQQLMGPALTIAMLGAIESLLCAVVLDGMTGRKHSSNAELVGQGLGNIVAPFFGGITATAAIARSAANVRAGATSPISGIVHALVVLAAILVLAPWLSWLPLSAMAALLLIVAWNMSEAHKVVELIRRAPRSDVLVLLVCLSLTVIFDMVIAITFGVILASLLFMREIAKMTKLHNLADHKRYAHEVPEQALLYKVNGPLFFAAAERVFGELVAQVKGHKLLVLQMEAVSILDAGGLSAFLQFEKQMAKAGVQLRVAELQFQPLKTLARAKVRPVPGQLEFYGSLEEALKGEHLHEATGN